MFKVKIAIFAEKSKVKITVENKMIAGVGFERNHVWAPCCETWLKREIRVAGKENGLREKKMLGSWVTPLVGRHVVNDSKIA